jgi:hypothetical protein
MVVEPNAREPYVLAASARQGAQLSQVITELAVSKQAGG